MLNSTLNTVSVSAWRWPPFLYRRNSILTLHCCVLRDSLKSLAAMLWQGKTPKHPTAQHSAQSTVYHGRPKAYTHQSHGVLTTGDNVLCKRMVIVGDQTLACLITFWIILKVCFYKILNILKLHVVNNAH